MADNRLLEFVLKVKDDATAALKGAEKSAVSFSERVGSAMKVMGAIAATLALGKFFKDAVDEAMEAERAMTKLGQAVKNSGGDFGTLRPAMEGAIDAVRRLSTYSDDELTASLGQLVLMTGNSALSMENLQLAADMAAASGMSLEEATALLGKTLNGQVTKGLKEFGVTATDADGALAQLHERTKGMAEHMAGTFSGALQKLGNDWKQFQQSVGKAIIGNDDLKGALGGLSGALAGVATFVENNAEVIGKLVTAAIEMGRAVWEVARVPLKIFAEALAGVTGFVGTLLQGIGWLVEEGGGLLKKFGIDTGTHVGASMKAAGAAIVTASQAAYDALEGTTKKGEKAVTKAATDGLDKRHALSADAAKQQEDLAKKAGDELTKLQGATAADLLRVYEGSTEKLAAETVRRHALVAELMKSGLVKQADQLKDAWKKQDDANLLLAAGFDKDLVPAVERTEIKLGALRDAAGKIPAAIDPATMGLPAMKEKLDEGSLAAEGVSTAIGGIDAAAGTSLGNVGNLVGKLIMLSTSANPAAMIGAVGALAGVLTMIFSGESPEEKARKELIRTNNLQLRDLVMSNGDLLRLTTSGGRMAGIGSALRDALTGVKPADKREEHAAIQSLIATLAERGLTLADISNLAKDMNVEIPKGRDGQFTVAGLQQFLQMIGATDPGFANTYAGQTKRIDTGLGLGAIKQSDVWGQLTAAIATGGPNAITQGLSEFNLTSAEGRAGAADRLKWLFNNLGGLNLESFGGMNQTEFTDAIGRLLKLLEDPVASGVGSSALPGGIGGAIDPRAFPPPPPGVGTDIPAPNLPPPDFLASIGSLADVGLQQVDYLGSIDANIGALLDRWTDIDVGRDTMARAGSALTVNGLTVDVMVTTAAIDAAGTGQAVQAAVLDAVNEALATAYRDSQLAQGNVARTL